MRYTVVWIKDAEQRLMSIWLDAIDREVVTNAANEIDRLLRDDPWGCSEERENTRRIAIVAPLGVIFRVSDEDRTVTILTVWRFRTKS